MEYNLVNIEQLPEGNPESENKLMFGIGAILHSVKFEDLAPFLANLIGTTANAFTIRSIFLDPSQDMDKPNWEIVIDAINYSITNIYGGEITCQPGQQIVFRITQVENVGGQPNLIYDYYALNSGATSLTSLGVDADETITSQITPLGRFGDELESGFVIELGNIGTDNIEDAFNGDTNEPFTIEGDTFIKAETSTGFKLWYWIGGLGVFGDSATLATSADFLLLTENVLPPVPLQYKQARVESGSTYTLIAEDLNRTIVFQNAVTVTIPNSVFVDETTIREQAWLSFKSTGTINYPTTDGASSLAVTAGALVYVERRNLSNEWIVKRVDNNEDSDSKWDIVFDNQYSLKVPTQTEWDNERLSWGSNNSAGAFGSPLKLTRGGFRQSNGSIGDVGTFGRYWTSTINTGSGLRSEFFSFSASDASFGPVGRVLGGVIRLIIDGTFTLQEFEDNYENEIWEFQGLEYGFVYNPTTQKIWLDRNLGTTQVAASSTDTAAYGHLYQWGRSPDGHQIRTSTTHPSSSGLPTFAKESGAWDGKFITTSAAPNDWLDPQNNNLWQGLAGFAESFDIGEKLIGKNGLKASYLDLHDLPTIPVLPNTIVESVTGDLVDNTDPANPIVETPTLQEAYDAEALPTNNTPDTVLTIEDGDVGETPISSLTLFNQYTTSSEDGDTAANLLVPDFGTAAFGTTEMQEENFYEGWIFGRIDVQDAGAKFFKLDFGDEVEIFNDTLALAEINYNLKVTIDFYNQVSDDIDAKVIIQGDIDGIRVYVSEIVTFDNTSSNNIEFIVEGHEDDTVYVDKAILKRC